MSVGSVVLQPQRLPRAEAAHETAAGLGDVVTLLGGIAYDTLQGGTILESLADAGVAMGERFATHAGSGAERATERLGAMLEAPLAGLAARAQAVETIEDPDAALAAAHDVLSAFVSVAESLTIDHIRQHLGELVDIIETDLGLTPTFLQEQAWAFVDEVVERLEHIPPESDESLRSNRIAVIGAIRRLERRVGAEFEFPELDVEFLSAELFALIRRTGIPDGAARAACVGAGLAQMTQTGRDVLKAVPFTGFLSGSVGAGVVPEPKSTDRFLWYPSWLANNHRPFLVDAAMLIPGDSVWVTEAEELVQRNRGPGREDQLIATAAPLWGGAIKRLGDEDTPYTFGVVGPEAMEKIAWISAISANGFELLFHLLSLERGDYASNVVNATGAAGYGAWKTVKREPFHPWIEGGLIRGLATGLASFEGMHTKASAGNCFLMWLTLAGPDYAEMLSYRYFTNAARDLLLSVLTLMNHVKSEPSRNVEEVDGVRHAIVLLVHNLFLLAAFKRENWGMIKSGGDASPAAELFLLWSLLGGVLVGGISGLLGSVAAGAISRDVSGKAIGRKLWWGMPQAVLLTPYWLYLQQEGSTSGGTFTPFAGAAFNGYPSPASTSPYRLPYDSSAVGSCYVGQANQGLWSHNFNNVGQIYAYDFSLDQGDEILAARGGTVVAFSESIPDDTDPGNSNPASTLATAIAAGTAPATIDVVTTAGFAQLGILRIGGDVAFYTSIAGNTFQGVTWQGGASATAHAGPTVGPTGNPVPGQAVNQSLFGWNFVAIRHDTVDATHDVGQGGAALTTVAVYGHGRTGSVTAAFGRHTTPVPTAQIIGTVVQQGMPIMDAGDTGISFHNHLHMHVVPDPGGGYLTFGGGGGVTLPFVFSDEDVGGDGVLQHFSFYNSSNTRVLA